MPAPIPPCPAQPDAVERDAAGSDTAASVRAEPRPAAPASRPAPARPVREPVSQSLFDLPYEAPSPLTGLPHDPPRPPPLSSASPPSPAARPALPTATFSSPTRSFQVDALAPGVRPSSVNAGGSAANGAAAFNRDL